jgi:hypothetical protein
MVVVDVLEDLVEDVISIDGDGEDVETSYETGTAVAEVGHSGDTIEGADIVKGPDIAEFRQQICWLEPDRSIQKRSNSRCQRRLAAVWKRIKHAVLRAYCCIRPE